MSQKEKRPSVYDFLKYTLTFSQGAYGVDDEGYVTIEAGEEPERFKRGNPPQSILLFQERINDTESAILNPFSEGIQETAAAKWYYRLMRVSLTARVSAVMRSVLNAAVHEKTEAAKPAAKRKKPAGRVPPAIVKLIGVVVKDVDEKMLTELQTLVKATAGDSDVYLLNLLYSRKMLATRFDIPIISEGDDWTAPSGIRKGTVAVFRKLLMAMFDVSDTDDLDKFTAKAHEDATPKIDSYMRCLFKVYRQLADVIDGADDELTIDLSQFKNHLDNMPRYTLNAKSVVNVSAPSVPKPSSVPVQTQPQNSYGSTPPQAGGTVVPGPVRADGTRMPPSVVNAPSAGYMGQPMPSVQVPNGGGWGSQPNMGNAGGYAAPGMNMMNPQMGMSAPMNMMGPQMNMGGGYNGSMSGGVQFNTNPYQNPVGPGMASGIRYT